jgi:hypothetical protein
VYRWTLLLQLLRWWLLQWWLLLLWCRMLHPIIWYRMLR